MRHLFFSFLGLMVVPAVVAQQSTLEYTAPFDVFQLDTVEHYVVEQGGGFFPVLNSIEDVLYTVYRTGAGHLGLGGALSMRWSMDGGLNWDAPLTVVDGPVDDRNPAVGMTGTGRIVVGYHQQGSYTRDGRYDASLDQAQCMITRSDDLGQTWTAPRPLGIQGLDRASPYGRILEVAGGKLLMTVYGPYTRHVPGMRDVRNDERDYAYLVRSLDEGETWQNPTLIAGGHNETALLAYPDGRMMAAARSVETQQIDLFHSLDAGRTWRPPLRITQPMQHPADLIELSNGWLLMLYGDRSRDFKTVRGIVSRDEGRSWDFELTCVFSRPVQGDFGYPSGAVLLSGHVAIQYYWAGRTTDGYDGSQARLYMTRFEEQEFIDQYTARYDMLSQ